ncbi:MAG TPA: DUF2203 domain-containing protein [Thermodesulfobacteriota bacterium]|nr:DUF2203 domain-containing protein [Thermodesulfobacteriota bacterium]
MAVRLFSVDEANRLVPTLERLMAELAVKKAELVAKQAELAQLLNGAPAGSPQARLTRLVRGKEELKFIAEEFNLCIHQITGLGCLVKDVDMGLVDFPTLRNGREAFLCWRRGEPRVAYWHGLEEGFAGRKPLDAPPPAPDEEPAADESDPDDTGTTH